jgi:triosephosphate isomerase (TIM)
VTSPNRTPLIAGNWKMNLDHMQAVRLVEDVHRGLRARRHDLRAVEVAVFPPFTALRSVQTALSASKSLIGHGAQDMTWLPDGAHTGEISATMLASLGCDYVLVGHSERRADNHEHNSTVNRKVAAALAGGITPILCVGEHLEVRKAHDQVMYAVSQLYAALAGVPRARMNSLVIAYEPVWAIGTGEVATPGDAQEVARALRKALRTAYSDDVADSARILYGGSVKPSNVKEIMAQPDVDGTLVGGASLKAQDFIDICTYRDL